MNFDILYDAGVTQGELAKILGVSRVTVNFWCNGKAEPSRFVQKKLRAVMAAITAAAKAGDLPISDKVDRVPQLKKVIVKYLTN